VSWRSSAHSAYLFWLWRLRASFSRHFLIGAQVAASCVLLIVSGLLVRAMTHAVSTSPGFEYRQVITIDPGLGSLSPAAARTHLDTRASGQSARHRGGVDRHQPSARKPVDGHEDRGSAIAS
jgi:hypothetical protein